MKQLYNSPYMATQLLHIACHSNTLFLHKATQHLFTKQLYISWHISSTFRMVFGCSYFSPTIWPPGRPVVCDAGRPLPRPRPWALQSPVRKICSCSSCCPCSSCPFCSSCSSYLSMSLPLPHSYLKCCLVVWWRGFILASRMFHFTQCLHLQLLPLVLCCVYV